MAEAASAGGDLELAIAAPERDGKHTIPLAGTFQVVLTNRSGRPVKIWEDGNSWGYAVLGFEITQPDGGKAIVRKKERSWRKNTPTFWTIGNGESHSYDVSLGSGEWDGLPDGLAGKTVMMRAILEIPEDAETREFGVWAGKVASPVGEYAFR